MPACKGEWEGISYIKPLRWEMNGGILQQQEAGSDIVVLMFLGHGMHDNCTPHAQRRASFGSFWGSLDWAAGVYFLSLFLLLFLVFFF